MTRLAPLPDAVPLAAPPPEDRPAHYRLSTETWELILAEYREGATAPFLSRKWRVSEHAIRRRITRHNATKRDWGDAQAIGQALAREAELEAARRNSPEAVAARLFEGVDPPDDAADPAALARLADRGRAAPPAGDPTEPGRQAALAFLRREALRDLDADPAPA